MARFTISQHAGSKEGDHFDLMLEEAEFLRTWRLQNTHFDNQQVARQIKDHRKTYLDYEGEVTGGRGRVKIWETGTFTADSWGPKLVQVALLGRQLRVRLRIELMGSEPGPDATWSVVDATIGLKRKVASHLRSAVLEAAPTPELETVKAALLEEERRLLSMVGSYSKGGSIEWAQAEGDRELRDRLHAEWVRWRHPWLDQAREFARKLDEIIEAIRTTKPAAV